MTKLPRRWNRTTLNLVSYGFEARTPDHWRSSGRLYYFVVWLDHELFLENPISHNPPSDVVHSSHPFVIQRAESLGVGRLHQV
ncbi:hypothetical protein CEXT_354431 [Caerostris extrusa]|uniref:Uncharacterized protein n=1 Tax=Caerostris extrusa TaxID=172846 RepID=A0AAV4Y5D0_CAEEX|nr:hypothetical protein CEXT_354431 [Caerostris extrusa]